MTARRAAARGSLLVTVALSVAPAGRVAAAAPVDHRVAHRVELDARVEAATRTEATIAAKREQQLDVTGRRLRALYKIGKRGRTAIWFDPAARAQLLRRRAAAARVLGRDLDELAILDEEARVARAASDTAALIRATPPTPPPAPASLDRPVAGARVVARFGPYRDGGIQLSRRGVELEVDPGAEVRAPADGQVRFVGPLRGLGTVVILDHGAFRTVLGGLAAPRVAVGGAVRRGEPVAAALGARVRVEVRLRSGDPAGVPVDPAPLLAL